MFTFMRSNESRCKAERRRRRETRKRTQRFAKANKLLKGQWYTYECSPYHHHPRHGKLYTEPSLGARTLAIIPQGALLLFIGTEEGSIKEHKGDDFLWKFIKVGYLDTFGYLAFQFKEVFEPALFLKKRVR